MSVIEYGDFSVDTASLPEPSVIALIRRGLAHFLGNEQRAKLAAWSEAWAKEHDGKAPTDEDKAAKIAELQSAALQALRDGTVGTRVMGPRQDPVEALMASMAKAEIVSQLKANGVKVPRKTEDTIQLADATVTILQLVEMRVARDGERLRKEATKVLRDRAKQAEAAKAKATAAGGAVSLESLGL